MRDPKSGYYIETPKTKSGYREIPMSEPVYQALKRVVKNRGKKTTIMIDGYTNFLFLKRDGTPKVGMDYNNMIRNLLKKYNKQHKEPLPNITPHSFRHTFCTRMANAGMNPKVYSTSWHANITMTLDYYTHVDACSVRAEMERLAAIVKRKRKARIYYFRTTFHCKVTPRYAEICETLSQTGK